MNSRHFPAAGDEPELNNERDIPTEDGAEDPLPAESDRGRGQRETVAGRESVAGEEDPGAALDTEADDADAPDAGR